MQAHAVDLDIPSLESFEHAVIVNRRCQRSSNNQAIYYFPSGNIMIEREDLRLVLQVVSEGSLAGAARVLDLAPSAVTKRLAALEARLKQRLFHRTTRRLQLTPEGEAFVQRAHVLLEGFAELEQELAERLDEPRGLLRICSSFGFGRAWVAPALARFQAAHPGVELQLHLAEQLPELEAGRFDAAVWLWRPTQAALRSRRLAGNRRIVVAAPAYLERAGVPREPAELSQHQCLVVREHSDRPALWRFDALARGAAPQAVRVHGALSSNSGEVVRDWALSGIGLMLRSLWDVHEHLASGRLVHVLPDHAMLDADIHFVTPPRPASQPVPKRLRLLQEHLARELADPPWADYLAPARSAHGPRGQPTSRPAPRPRR
jgi:DNA-binding transcriptional LysR family regulator